MEKNVARFTFHTSFRTFFLIAIVSLPGCVHRKQIDRQKLHIAHPPLKSSNKPIEPPPITIWVHGTLTFRKPIYHHVFNNKSGVMPAIALPEDHHFYTLAKTIAEHDPEHFPLEEFYIFGWSGRLQNQERKEAAEKLYNEIITLTAQYKEKYKCEPIIRILAHSHGGNVVLNMAKIKKTLDSIRIKSLILLACPVQEKTMHLISTPMFERVYSLYSSLDMIQVLAPQFKRSRIVDARSTWRKYHYRIPPFSSRLFPNYEHLTQTKIKINDYPISHTRFSTKEFTALLPTILQKLDDWHAESIAANLHQKHKLLCIYKESTI